MAAASGVSAKANRAATAAVVVVLLVVGLVVALTGGDSAPSAGGGSYMSSGPGGAAGGQGVRPGSEPGRAEGQDSTAPAAPGADSADASGFQDSLSPLDALLGSGDQGLPAGPAAVSEGGMRYPGDGSGSAGQQGGTAANRERTPRSGSTTDGPGGAGGDRANSDVGTSAVAGGARVVGSHRVNEQILDLTIYSPALSHNTGVRLLLPPNWSRNPDRSWPTLYMLPGYHHSYSYRMGDHRDWTNVTDIEQFMAGKPVLTVLPSGGGSGFFTNWWNSGQWGTPKWETYHTQELPAVLEAYFGGSGNRAIAGLSLAGYGAVEYAADHPGMYNGVASYSGVLHTTFPGMPALAKQMWENAGIEPEQIWGDPYQQRDIWRANDPWHKVGKLCGQGINLYLSAGTGIPGKHDPSPTQNAKALLRALQNDPLSYFNSYGQASLLETAAAVTTRTFAGKVRAVCGVSTVTSLVTGTGGGIDLTTDYTLRGTHRWAYWEDAFHESWPVLAESLGLPAG